MAVPTIAGTVDSTGAAIYAPSTDGQFNILELECDAASAVALKYSFGGSTGTFGILAIGQSVVVGAGPRNLPPPIYGKGNSGTATYNIRVIAV